LDAISIIPTMGWNRHDLQDFFPFQKVHWYKVHRAIPFCAIWTVGHLLC
jgi:hypothetical protein